MGLPEPVDDEVGLARGRRSAAPVDGRMAVTDHLPGQDSSALADRDGEVDRGDDVDRERRSSSRSSESQRRRGRGRWRRSAAEPDADGGEIGDRGPDADPEQAARTIVLRKLTGQPRTRQQLADALAERDVPDDAAQTVLDRMEEVGLVDDRGFAHDWVESRQSRRHLSRSAIRRELVTRGIDRDHIDEALDGVDDQSEYDAALTLAEKKARTMSRLEPEVRRRRLVGALARRGFTGSIVTQVLRDLRSTD